MYISLIYIVCIVKKSNYFGLQDIDECAENNGTAHIFVQMNRGHVNVLVEKASLLTQTDNPVLVRICIPFYSGLNYNNEACEKSLCQFICQI